MFNAEIDLKSRRLVGVQEMIFEIEIGSLTDLAAARLNFPFSFFGLVVLLIGSNELLVKCSTEKVSACWAWGVFMHFCFDGCSCGVKFLMAGLLFLC
jgi:hypothetical protein